MAFDTRSRYNLVVRIIALLVAFPPQIAAGAVLAFAAHDIYPVYSICGRAFGGITALQDQQIGAIIFWLHGAMMSIIGAYILVRRGINGARA
jgi:putative membrane protein